MPSLYLSIRSGTLRSMLFLAFAGLISGCSTTSRFPPAPATVDFQDYQYKISVLDTLNILVWRNPELSSTVTVRPDGRISAPLVEDVVAVGRSPAELAREVEKALAKFIRDPVVTIIVGGFQGVTASQVRVAGEVPKPQAVQYRPDMTLLDLMIQAGGMSEFADGNGAVLVRNAEGGKVYALRLKDLLKRGDISANVAVIPGDIVIVPQTVF
jgi:polysaccharide export outer membrane protein